MTPGRFHGQGQLCSPTPVTLALDAPAAEIQDAQYSLRTCSSELPRTLSPEQLSQGIPRGCSPWFWPSSTRPDKLRRSPAEHPQELAGQRTTQKPRDTYNSQPLVEPTAGPCGTMSCQQELLHGSQTTLEEEKLPGRTWRVMLSWGRRPSVLHNQPALFSETLS